MSYLEKILTAGIRGMKKNMKLSGGNDSGNRRPTWMRKPRNYWWARKSIRP